MRIISLNCRAGINNKDKLKKLIYYLQQHPWHIALLQETSKINAKAWDKISRALNVKILQDPNTQGKPGTGTATLIKDNILNKVVSHSFLHNTRTIEIIIEEDNQKYHILNTYIHTKNNEKHK